MTRGKAASALDFDALRLGIEGNDPDVVLDFYAEDARLSIISAEAQRGTPFELRGRAEIAKHLRAVFGPETSHRVEREVVGEERVTFREACEYADGGRVWVETTLDVRDGKIVHQVDMVAKDRQAVRERPLRSEQATEKEDLR
jgi:SnoaL-like protein